MNKSDIDPEILKHRIIDNSKWNVFAAKPVKALQLAFSNKYKIITNSIPIDDRSITMHQYKFDIFIKNENTDNKQNEEEVEVEADLDQNERREIYKKLMFIKTYMFLREYIDVV